MVEHLSALTGPWFHFAASDAPLYPSKCKDLQRAIHDIKLSSESRDCNSVSVSLFIAMMLSRLPNLDWRFPTVFMFPYFSTIFNFLENLRVSSGVIIVRPCELWYWILLFTISTRSAICSSLKPLIHFLKEL